MDKIPVVFAGGLFILTENDIIDVFIGGLFRHYMDGTETAKKFNHLCENSNIFLGLYKHSKL